MHENECLLQSEAGIFGLGLHKQTTSVIVTANK